jgi:kumamolisin
MPSMVPLSGSERDPLPSAKMVGPADPAERITVTVIVRRKNEEALKQHTQARRHISRQEFAAAHGADTTDLDEVAAYARKYGIEVVGNWPAQRRIALRGTIADLSRAFGTELAEFEHAGGRYRGRIGPLYVPEHLQGVIQTVAGLDNRPAVKPHFRVAADNAEVSGTFAPPEIGLLYNFPTGVDGTGQTVGILEFGGGYRDSDIDAYFTQLGLRRPQVTSIGIDGATNRPTGDPASDDAEGRS